MSTASSPCCRTTRPSGTRQAADSLSTRRSASWKYGTRKPWKNCSRPSTPSPHTQDKRLFADVNHEDLTRLGVDPAILPLVRVLTSEEHLQALQTILPDVQYTALLALATGMTVEEAWSEYSRPFTPNQLASILGGHGCCVGIHGRAVS
jgi:hypothetical protein